MAHGWNRSADIPLAAYDTKYVRWHSLLGYIASLTSCPSADQVPLEKRKASITRKSTLK